MHAEPQFDHDPIGRITDSGLEAVEETLEVLSRAVGEPVSPGQAARALKRFREEVPDGLSDEDRVLRLVELVREELDADRG